MSNETVTVSREEYESLKATNEELRQANAELAQQLQNLVEQIALARKQLFGSSSEKTVPSDIGEQLSYLFNEAEVIFDAVKESKQPEEPDLTTVKEHTRSRRRITHEADLPENVTVEVIENKLEGDDLKCPLCGEEMVEAGEVVVRRLKLIPAQAVIEETHTKRYACFKCKEEEAEPVFVNAPSASPVIPGSNATAEAIAFLAEEKFSMYVNFLHF